MTFKEKRESKNMTQTEVANRLGVKRTAVAMWEAGKSLPNARLLPMIAKMFECTIEELLQDEIKASGINLGA